MTTFNEVINLYKQFNNINAPKAIIVKTKTGIPFMNDNNLWHYRVPSFEDLSNFVHNDFHPHFGSYLWAFFRK